MAFSAEQKAAIKARAKQLVSQGISEGEAAQAAVAEIVGAPESPAFKEATGFVPFGQEPVKASAAESLVLDTKSIEASLAAEEEAYVRARSSQLEGQIRNKNVAAFDKSVKDLEASGVSKPEAIKQSLASLPKPEDEAALMARRELQSFREPAPFGFGPPEERREESILLTGAEALLPAAAKRGESAPTSYVDWNQFKQSFAAAYGTEREEEAAAAIEAFKSEIFEPLRLEAAASGLDEKAAEFSALQKGLKELENIDERIKDKSSYLKDEGSLKRSGDPLIAAFSRSIEIGEGVPNLTPRQMSYISAIEGGKINAKVEAKKKEGKKKTVIVLTDGRILNAADYDPEIDGKKFKEIKSVPLDEGDIKRELAAEGEVTTIPWWADPTKRDYVILNPEKFEQGGIFTTTTPYGSKKETVGNWLLRSSLTIPNILAGAVSETASMLSPEIEKGREERRKATKMQAADGAAEDYSAAILTNIKENRGYFGETAEALDIKNITAESDPGLYYGALVGGFALDVMDPSLDILRGVSVGAKTGLNAYKTIGSLYNPSAISKLGPAAKAAATAGAKDFLNSWIVTSGLSIDPGDIRGLIGKDLTADYASAILAKKLVDEAPGITVAQVNNELQKANLIGGRWNKAFNNSPGSDRASDALSRIDNLFSTSASDINNELSKISKALSGTEDEILSKIGKGDIRRKDLGRIIGAAASYDQNIQSFLRGLSKRQGVPEIDQLAAALLSNPEYRDTIIRGIAANKAGTDVVKATKGIETFDNLVAITENTWAGKSIAKDILAKVKGSNLGKISEELSKTSPKLRAVRERIKSTVTKIGEESTEAKIVPTFDLSPSQGGILLQTVSDLRTYNKLSPEEALIIGRNLNAGFITASDLRSLLSYNIDLVAEGMSAAGKTSGVLRARDLARAPISSQVGLLEPLETRTLNKKVLRQIFERLSGPFDEATRGALSLGQKRLVSEASGKLAALENKLIRDLKSGISDKEFRELYGITTNDRSQILSHLIVGPKEELARVPELFKVERIEDLLLDSLSDLFYTSKTVESVFDMFKGTSFSSASAPLSRKGIDEIEPMITEAAERIVNNPSSYFDELKALDSQVSEWINAAASDPTARSYLSFDPSEYKSATAEAGGVLPAESQISSYYRSESKAIEDELISTLLQKEIGKGSFNRRSYFDEAFLNSQGLTDEVWIQTIKDQVEGRLRGLPKPDDIIGSTAYDLAANILRQADISGNPISIAGLDTLFNQISKSTDNKAKLNILFGKNVSDQISSQFEKGFDSIRASLASEYLSAADKSKTALVSKGIKSVYNGLSNLFYTFTLNLRPRFHGANLLTGIDLAYGTTGRLINPRDVLEGFAVQSKTGGFKPSQILFTDPSGRSWTAGEVSSILEDLTGKSIYGVEIPGAASDRIKSILTQEVIGRKSPKLSTVLEAWNRFKGLPQTEDLAFRYAILKKALKQGRSSQDAIDLARRSMFDSGNLTGVEKSVKNIFTFYGFQRNNILNALSNLTSFSGLKRIRNVVRLKESLSDVLVGDEAEEYSPSYAQTRILLGKVGFDPEKATEILLASAPLPTLDGVYSLGEFVKLEPSGIFAGAVRPEFQALLGVEKAFDPAFNKVPAEHIAYLSIPGMLTDTTPLDVINYIVVGFGGDPVVPVKAQPGRENLDGAVDGWIYPLDTPAQKKAYKRFFDILSYPGITTVATDIARTAKAEGTKVAATDETGLLTGGLSFGIGLATPMAFVSPERQAYYDKLSRLKALQDAVKDANKTVIQNVKAELTPEEAKAGAEIKAAQTEGKRLRSASTIIAELEQLRKELGSLFMQGLSEDDPRIQKKLQKVDELSKELENLQ